MLKACGYLFSTVSVVLLGLVAWDGAQDDPTLRGALIAGMALSVLGMAVRLVSHLRGKPGGPANPRPPR
ncbi:MAG: hypothetical protein JNL41_04050 [Phenylobacterium sp.]|uniref:hypothetical protein n=1 Tax=Phenylobacterium sp. TaxID=1871053 RepID=UPI001A42DDD5|nr:hypothetical protein [Phenylobacterium sp.]MBL8553427.1 hypothetical protein [Phenylobacterium sp.]